MKKLYLLLIITLVVFVSCQDTTYMVLNGETQGTTYHIIYNKNKDFKVEVDSLLKEVDLSISIYNEKSILARINNNEDVEINQHVVNIFNKAMEISKNSDGLYDITVGPLVNLYGFGKDDRQEINDTIIDSLLQFVGYQKVRIKDNKIVKDNPGMKIDMNSIAQGYTVDVIANFFEKQGIFNYLIEVGGEVLVKGKNEYGEPWRVGVEKPLENTDITDREVELIVAIKDEKKSVATSGNYRKFYLENGVKFTHTINPQTGYPARDSLVSATILADDCTTADGYATACLVSGFEKAKKIVANVGLEAFFIYIDNKGNYKFYMTPGFEKYVVEQ